MARLRELNDCIIRVTSTEEANKLVKTWLPNQAKGIDSPEVGTEAGVRNCSLIAEFIVAFYSYRKAQYDLTSLKRTNAKPIPLGQFDLKKRLSTDPQLFLVELGGHNLTIIREGSDYGLYQAWDGEYHVFPKLNDDGESHNIFGTGDDTVRLINNEVDYALRKSKSDEGPKVTSMLS
ncbi:MAG TPA: hypothetical protein VHV80_01395 [Steroidobacteraceae bacterium]|jgi:hypothetical protein|nr:hypothetical protein [Steroidobacteraceae bacterium]